MSMIPVTSGMVIRLPLLLKRDVGGKKQEQRQAFLNCHPRFALPPPDRKDSPSTVTPAQQSSGVSRHSPLYSSGG